VSDLIAEERATRAREAEARRAAAETASETLLLEMSKALLTGTLATTRGAMQILQGVTGILLASYTALLAGFGKQAHVDKISAILLAMPIVFYILSLLTGFVQVILYRGAKLTLGDFESGVKAFEAVVRKQRRQLILPLLLMLMGLGSVLLVIEKILRMG
jgi:hypothetical protein